MALRSLKLLQISILFLLLFTLAGHAQAERIDLDSIFGKLYDKNANIIESVKLRKTAKPMILVSTSHCSACVKYFAAAQKNYQFIFVINNKSLLEINRLLSLYKLKPKQVYFVVADDIRQKKKIILSGPTPLAFLKSKSKVYFIDYPVLNTITQEFTADHKKTSEGFTIEKTKTASP